MEENNQKHWSVRESLSFQRQVSETMRLGILLALSGGLMDAYSYLFRGEVFANAQTGNILLCSVALSQGEWGVAVQYAFPVLAFGLGILMTFLIRQRFRNRTNRIHWRQLGVLAEISKSQKIVPATIEFVDIAGLVKGASHGEGLGNQFLSNIRECDAIVHVVRCFEDTNVIHVDGSIDPIRDIETINLELIFADMEAVERRMQKTAKGTKTNDKKLICEDNMLKRLYPHLEAGESARTFECKDDEEQFYFNQLNLLTAKPILYAANVSEDDAAEGNAMVDAVRDYAAKEGSEVFVICAEIENEIAQLEPEEAAEFLESLGLAESGLDRLVAASYKLLGLISYLTTGEKETRAWTIRRGTKAPQAAGKIHSDFERGFIRAEVVSYDDFTAAGNYAAAREAGKVRLEGKEYVVKDGDIIEFLFNV